MSNLYERLRKPRQRAGLVQIFPTWDSCDPSPCATASEDASWGSLKARFH